MHNSKIIGLLKTLEAKDFRRIEEAAGSPLFNKNEELIRFTAYVMRFAPRFVNKKLEKEAVWKALYPKQAYDEKQLSYLMSGLLKLAEDYLKFDFFEKKEPAGTGYLLHRYNQLGLDKHFQKIMREARKALDNRSHEDAEYFFDSYMIEEAENAFFDKQKKRTTDKSLQKAIDNLDVFYLIKKLQYSCEIINRQNVITADYRLNFLNEIQQYLQGNPHEDIPAVAVYYQILLMLLEKENPEHFYRLKNLLKEHANKFSTREGRDMYTYAQNYCINKINKGELGFMQELFDLYKTVLDKQVIFENGYLSHWTYKNIAGLALALSEYEWAEEFINTYKEKLPRDIQETAFAYNLANLLFYKKQYGKALTELQKVDMSDIFYHLNTKRMLIKIYYELGEEELLLSHLAAFKIYLKRNKVITDYVSKSYINLIQMMRRLLNADSTEKMSRVKKEIANNKHIADYKWLQEKLKIKESALLPEKAIGSS